LAIQRPVEVRESSELIPVHFAYRRNIDIEAGLSGDGKSTFDQPLLDVFDTPNFAATDAQRHPANALGELLALFRNRADP
jgi:hypothetical protein